MNRLVERFVTPERDEAGGGAQQLPGSALWQRRDEEMDALDEAIKRMRAQRLRLQRRQRKAIESSCSVYSGAFRNQFLAKWMLGNVLIETSLAILT